MRLGACTVGRARGACSLDGDGGCCGAVLDAQFDIDALQVFLHSPAAAAKNLADLLVRFSLSRPGQDFCFPMGQTEGAPEIRTVW